MALEGRSTLSSHWTVQYQNICVASEHAKINQTGTKTTVPISQMKNETNQGGPEEE